MESKQPPCLDSGELKPRVLVRRLPTVLD
jgi:hypothetical protein